MDCAHVYANAKEIHLVFHHRGQLPYIRLILDLEGCWSWNISGLLLFSFQIQICF